MPVREREETTHTSQNRACVGYPAPAKINADIHFPVPERLTLCGLLFAPSVMVSIALSAPNVLGANVRLMVHDECPARLELQVCEDTAKSPALAPDRATLDMPTAALVLFISVTTLAALVLPIP